MKAAGYCRVSSKKQVRGLSLEVQEERLRERATREGWDLEIFVEKGFTGRRLDRPVLGQVLQRLAEFDVLMLPKLDRLGRNEREMNEFRWKLEDAGVKLLFLEPEIDFDTVTGKIVWHVMVLLAEEESERIGARVASVSEARARQGKQHQGPPTYGYAPDPEKGLAPLPPEAAVLVRTFREYVSGQTTGAIARALNDDGVRTKQGKLWTPAGVSKLLRNPVYKGLVVSKGVEYPGLHEPLVEPKLWDQVADLRQGRNRKKGGAGRLPRHHLFAAGLLRCAYCGYAMMARSAPDDYTDTYFCRGRREHGPEFCPQTPVPRNTVDEAVWHYFEEVSLDVEATRAELSATLEDQHGEAQLTLREAERESRQAAGALERVRRDYATGEITAGEWRDLKADLQQEYDATIERVDQLQRHLDAVERTMRCEDQEAEVLKRLAELRAAMAGEVSAAGTVAGVRSSLLRLFDVFGLARLDIAGDTKLPPETAAWRRQTLEEARSNAIPAGDEWVVIPWPRREVDEELGVGWEPILKREAIRLPLGLGEKSASGGRSALSAWRPIWLRR